MTQLLLVLSLLATFAAQHAVVEAMTKRTAPPRPSCAGRTTTAPWTDGECARSPCCSADRPRSHRAQPESDFLWAWLALLASLAALKAAAACRWSRRAGSTKPPACSLCLPESPQQLVWGGARIDELSDDLITSCILPLCDLRALTSLHAVSRAWRDRATSELAGRQAVRWVLGGTYTRLGAQINFSGGLAAHGDTLVTAGSSGIASRCAGLHYAGVWSASRGDLLCSLDCESRVTAVATDGARVAVGCDDATVRVFSLSDGALECALVVNLPGASPIVCVDIRGDQVAGGGGDITQAIGGFRVWDLSTRQLLAARLGHAKAVTSIEIVERGLWSASADGSARLWMAGLPHLQISLQRACCLPHARAVTSLRACRDVAVTACEDCAVRVWRVPSTLTLEGWVLSPERVLLHDYISEAVALRGNLLVCGGAAGQLSVWSLDGSEEATRVAQLDAHLGTVSGVAILASGLVASLESDTESVFAVGKLCVWTPVKGV